MFRRFISFVSLGLLFGLACVSNAAIIGFQAESGVLGAEFDPPIIDSTALGGQYITVETSAGGEAPNHIDRVATYTVTFPEAGTYDLYARLYIQSLPQSGGDNDSMFYINGFGTKNVGADADWVKVNGLGPTDAGYPLDEWVWINLSEEIGSWAGGDEDPISFTVPADNLTQTLQIGGREDGLRIDAFVFATATDTFTDQQLDAAVPQVTKAYDPVPADDSTVSATSLVLSWQPGALAVNHHVYFSSDLNEVTDRTEQADKGLTTALTYSVSGLVPGTMYYWAVDEVGGSDIWPGDVWSFEIQALTAYLPDPYDGEISIDPNVVLDWSPGISAVSHNVYLDTVKANVEARSGCLVNGVSTTAANYSPGPLDFDTTYYWAIDEVGGPPDNMIQTGNAWSFTTMPDIQISDPNLIGWWTFDEDGGNSALDWSGHGNNGALQGNPAWVAGYNGYGGALSFDGLGDYVNCGNAAIFDITGPITVATWIKVDKFEQEWQSIVTKGEDTWRLVRNNKTDQVQFACSGAGAVSGTINVNDGQWHHLVGMYNGSTIYIYVDGQEDAFEDATGPINTNELNVFIGETERPDAGPRQWNGLMDDVRIYNKALTQQEIQQILRINPLFAWNPGPINGQLLDLIGFEQLSWSPGDEAAEHDVYFGTDKESVANADTSTADIYRGRQQGTTFTIGEGVQAKQTYFWRIDEINNDTTITKGGIWAFTISDYLIVDDFESYNDLNIDEEGSKRIYLTWIDGFDNPTVNGSTMGYPTPDFANGEHFVETGIVHGGSQSAPIFYDNTTAGYSEVTANTSDLHVGSDWTIGSPDTLSLWVYGDPNNSTTEQMYVKVNNAKVVYDGELTVAEWQQWTIDLATLGVNLNNVTTMSIGFEKTGATGGSGRVFVDDIQLNFPVITE